MHIKITNGAPANYSVAQLRADNPQTSFPATIPDSLLVEWDMYPLTPTNRPDHDYTKNVTEGTAVLQNGVWTQVWVVTDATPEEIDQRTQDQASNVRVQRNNLLSATDWRFRIDMNPSQEWKDYCQALRDITEQVGFPWEVIWPIEPA